MYLIFTPFRYKYKVQMCTFKPTDSFCTIFLRVYILRCLQKWRGVHLRDEEREKYSTSADSSQQKGKKSGYLV